MGLVDIKFSWISVLVKSAKGANYICTLVQAKLATIFCEPFDSPLVGCHRLKVSTDQIRQSRNRTSTLFLLNT